MSELLARLFIKNHLNTEDKNVRAKYGTLSSIVGIITNFILAAIKFVAGLLSASVAIMADAFNNLSDAGSSVITLVSFKISAKPADRDHPFGHARMEYISSMIISFLILLVGFELLMDSGKKLIYGTDEPTKITLVTIIILSFSILMKLWLGIFNRKTGKKIGSDTLIAASADCFTDTISTTAVLICAVVAKITGWYTIDAIVGLAVSALILIAGAKILNETKNALLGEAPVSEMIENIRSIVSEYEEVLGVHDLMVHNYGPKTYIASFHAEVDGEANIYELHDTIDNIERSIKERLDICCTIHMDPIVTNDKTTNELKEFLLSAIAAVDAELTVHDFRVVVGNTHTNLIFDVVVPFECRRGEDEITRLISDAVHAKDENCHCVITVDRG